MSHSKQKDHPEYGSCPKEPVWSHLPTLHHETFISMEDFKEINSLIHPWCILLQLFLMWKAFFLCVWGYSHTVVLGLPHKIKIVLKVILYRAGYYTEEQEKQIGWGKTRVTNDEENTVWQGLSWEGIKCILLHLWQAVWFLCLFVLILPPSGCPGFINRLWKK